MGSSRRSNTGRCRGFADADSDDRWVRRWEIDDSAPELPTVARSSKETGRPVEGPEGRTRCGTVRCRAMRCGAVRFWLMLRVCGKKGMRRQPRIKQWPGAGRAQPCALLLCSDLLARSLPPSPPQELALSWQSDGRKLSKDYRKRDKQSRKKLDATRKRYRL